MGIDIISVKIRYGGVNKVTWEIRRRKSSPCLECVSEILKKLKFYQGFGEGVRKSQSEEERRAFQARKQYMPGLGLEPRRSSSSLGRLRYPIGTGPRCPGGSEENPLGN